MVEPAQSVQFYLYLAACIAVPALWGALTAWWFTRRDDQQRERSRKPPVDYII